MLNSERVEFLHKVLEYSTRTNMLTVGERICINQERGKLFDQQNGVENINLLEAPDFNHSKELTNRIDFIATKINNNLN